MVTILIVLVDDLVGYHICSSYIYLLSVMSLSLILLCMMYTWTYAKKRVFFCSTDLIVYKFSYLTCNQNKGRFSTFLSWCPFSFPSYHGKISSAALNRNDALNRSDEQQYPCIVPEPRE